MKKIFLVCITLLIILSCASSPEKKVSSKEPPVRIANDSLEYEIIIFDTGFDLYLKSIARSQNYYDNSFYRTKNNFYVVKWNNRVNDLNFDQSIYVNRIDYSTDIDYGIEVNYKLYNYFKFVNYKYKENL